MLTKNNTSVLLLISKIKDVIKQAKSAYVLNIRISFQLFTMCECVLVVDYLQHCDILCGASEDSVRDVDGVTMNCDH